MQIPTMLEGRVQQVAKRLRKQGEISRETAEWMRENPRTVAALANHKNIVRPRPKNRDD
jgi:hypothetical protein